ncbi:MAG TPA: T9SS type A sorting domain-containing protein, partial [Chitinophagales bacterium]|nr:T9SS type A sorting domain-containing protein [Chitinophagales bacterium]
VVEPAVPLPVELLAFEAVQTDHGADISWNTASEFDVSSYVVSRSSDGVNFNPLGEISATGNATTSADYLLLDDEPLFGNNYYQLEVVNLNGEVDETYLTALYVDGTASRPVVYPNPSRGSVTISIPIGLPLAGIQIFDISGRLIREINTLSATVPIGINDLTTGTYVIKFISTIDIDNQLLIFE